MAGKPGRSGGARPGAGRKPIREKFAEQVDGAEAAIAGALDKITSNLIALANGSKRVTEKWIPAGLVVIDKPMLDPTGEVRFTDMGAMMKSKQPVFPDIPADKLVLIERTAVSEGPNPTVNMYLETRILGNPITPAEEPEVTPEEIDGALIEAMAAIETHVKDPDARRVVADAFREASRRISGEDRSG